MKKKILIMLCILSLIAAAFAGCSQKDVDADATSSAVSTTQTTTAVSTTKAVESTTKPTETTTAKKDSTASTKAPENKSTTNTTKSSTTTTKSAAVKTTAKQTTKSTTKKQTTTKKVTTTKKKTTTKKNVTAKEVQNQVNSYIRSRGITVDSSLNPNNAGWSSRISGFQEDLNNGYTLRSCKYDVDEYIREMGTNLSMYCYYRDNHFYVCYL